MNTNELLDAAKAALGIESDYALTKALEARKGLVTGWRKKKSMPSNRVAYQLAEILKMPPEEVLILIEIDFAKTEEDRSFWGRALAKALARAASTAGRKGAAVLLAAALALGAITGAGPGAPGSAKP